MNTTQNTTTPPRPTSSPTSSRRRDDLPQVTSSLVPHPSGGRGHSELSKTTTKNTPPPRPRDEVTTCVVINCRNPATGTATDVLGPQDTCHRCGLHFWGNHTAYPSAPLFDLGALR